MQKRAINNANDFNIKSGRMQASGRAYVNPASTDEYKGTAEKYNAESQKLERMNGRLYSSYNNLKRLRQNRSENIATQG